MRGGLVLVLVFFVFANVATAQDWEAQESGSANVLQGVWFVDEARGFVVGDAGTVLHTEDGGETWVPILLTNGDILDVAFVDLLTGVIVGDSGRVFRTVDGGDTWTEIPAVTDENLLAVAFGADGRVYAAGRNGTIVRSTDLGATWSLVETGGERYRGVAAVGQHAWAVGNNGVIRATTDGGLTWSFLPGATSEDLHAVSFVSENEGWIAGQSNTLMYTDDGGTTWTSRNSSIGVGLNAVFFGNSELGWAGGRFGNMFVSADGALTWDTQNTQGIDDVNDLAFTDAFHGWGVGDNGSIVSRVVPSVEISLDAEEIDWQPVAGDVVYDVVRGDLDQLRDTLGDFSASASGCVAEDLAGTSVSHGPAPPPGAGAWFLVRVVAGGENGTYDSGSFTQSGGRDEEVGASGLDCL